MVAYALQTICPDEHFNAFKVVRTTDGLHVIDVKELFYYKAFDIQLSYSCGGDSSNSGEKKLAFNGDRKQQRQTS